MKWEITSWMRVGILLFSVGLLAATVFLRQAHAIEEANERPITGYTSHSERVTEYLFNGNEYKFAWV